MRLGCVRAHAARRVTRTLDAVTQGRSLLRQLARGQAGELVVGASPAISTYVLPAALRAFSGPRPDVALRVRTGGSAHVLEMVQSGEVEVGIARELTHGDVDKVHLYDDELVLVMKADRQLGIGSGAPTVSDLAHEQLILFDSSSSYHELTGALFRRAGVTPRAVMELDNIDATKKMFMEGLGIAFLPHAAVLEELRAGTLTATPLADAEPLRRSIVTMTRPRSGPLSGPAAAFLPLLPSLELPATESPRSRARCAPGSG